MYDLLFRSAIVVVGDKTAVRDVAVRAGLIERVEPSLSGAAREVVDCHGLALLPGAIDVHVHLREPGLTHKEDIASGTAAAVASGVTAVLEMPNTKPPTTTLDRLIEKAEIAARSARCHIRFYMALTRDNLDEIERAVSHPAFAGVKVFLGSTTGQILVEDPAVIERALDRVPALFAFHAETESVLTEARCRVEHPLASHHHLLRPPEAVVAGAHLVASLASKPGRRLHLCHLSSKGEIGVLAQSRLAGRLTSEVTPHHLFFTWEDTIRLQNFLKVNPPVRERSDRDALLLALRDGLVDVLATDHAPHSRAEKCMTYLEAPSGVPGLDTLVPAALRLVQIGALDLPKAVRLLSENPASLAGFEGKGRVAEGYDADLMLCDLGASWVPDDADIRSRCGWTPFAGETLAARPLAVWVAGERRV